MEEVGAEVTSVRPGDRVTVNVETFCGECFFCRHGYVNNCTDPNGGWALGCRIDGGQAEYVRVPYADQGLNRIPDTVSDEQALFVGDVLATGFWATRISEISEEDVVSDELLPEDVLSDFEEPLLVSEEVLLSELEELLLSLSDAELDIPPSALEAFVSVPESLLQAAK